MVKKKKKWVLKGTERERRRGGRRNEEGREKGRKGGRKEGRKGGRKEEGGCVSRCVFCTGVCRCRQLSLVGVSCVFFVDGAEGIHASQPLRGDTRSGRAMHTTLHSEVPRLSSILSVNSWMGRLVGCVSLPTGPNLPLLGPQCGKAVKPFGLEEPTKSQLAPVRAFQLRRQVLNSRLGGDQDAIPSGKCTSPSGPSNKSFPCVPEGVQSVRICCGSRTPETPSPFEWGPTLWCTLV